MDPEDGVTRPPTWVPSLRPTAVPTLPPTGPPTTVTPTLAPTEVGETPAPTTTHPTTFPSWSPSLTPTIQNEFPGYTIWQGSWPCIWQYRTITYDGGKNIDMDGPTCWKRCKKRDDCTSFSMSTGVRMGEAYKECSLYNFNGPPSGEFKSRYYIG